MCFDKSLLAKWKKKKDKDEIKVNILTQVQWFYHAFFDKGTLQICCFLLLVSQGNIFCIIISLLLVAQDQQ